MIVIKLLIVIIIIIGFFLVVTTQIENFTDTKKIVNDYSITPDYYKINSSLPYDITVKNENLLIYDFGNDELNSKFNVIFDIQLDKQINLIEGIEWNNWTSVDDINYLSLIGTYYNNTIVHFKNKMKEDCLKLPNNNEIFNVVKNTLNRYKIAKNNSNICMLDIDIVIYRNKKPLARHLKIIVVCNNNFTTFLLVKVIGVIKECDIIEDTIKGSVIDNYSEFIPEREIIYNQDDYIYDFNEKRENSQISFNLYNKLLKDLK